MTFEELQLLVLSSELASAPWDAEHLNLIQALNLM